MFFLTWFVGAVQSSTVIAIVGICAGGGFVLIGAIGSFLLWTLSGIRNTLKEARNDRSAIWRVLNTHLQSQTHMQDPQVMEKTWAVPNVFPKDNG